ncbi:hypothetical protein RKD35_002890 [Streptomyces albogriseolus]
MSTSRRLRFERRVDAVAVWLIDRRRFTLALALWRTCRMI